MVRCSLVTSLKFNILHGHAAVTDSVLLTVKTTAELLRQMSNEQRKTQVDLLLPGIYDMWSYSTFVVSNILNVGCDCSQPDF